jgi:Gas vesicle synthesis protein GvpO
MASESRTERQEARARRRSLTSKPFEQMDEAADSDQQTSPRDGAKSIAGKAAAAALAGALGGALKAYVDRRGRADEQDEPDAPEEQGDEPQAAQQPTADESQQDVTDEAEPQDEAAEPHAEADAEAEADDEQATNEHDSHEEGNGARGASSGDASRVVRQARQHLEDLFGIEAEGVSGLQRSNGSWRVTVEAVEVHRVPESQDVLASYEVVLDDDGGVVSVERTHRYRRAQVEGD